jgi:hypothetical protein
VTDYRCRRSVIRSWTRAAVMRQVILPISGAGLPILQNRPASELQDYRSACESPFPAYASAPVHAIRAGMRLDPTSVIGNPIMILAGGPR